MTCSSQKPSWTMIKHLFLEELPHNYYWSHLYPVVTPQPPAGELFAPAGPGEENAGGDEGEADDEEPGEATPGLSVQHLQTVHVLSYS